ncbi:DUF4276 family protein [Candidatus Palauibacter sp.]|uniref:DUF4276 family protein n=1 Tax=Candidatus Palauibacter sp. TaxID=3101350 RepID=UPI003B015E56
MIRLAISVEGVTEEDFVKRSLGPHLRGRGVHATPILLGRARGTARGGGDVTVDRVVNDMQRLRHSHDAVTSLVDFYGFRGKGTKSVDDLLRVIADRIGESGHGFVFPYIQMHEFEGLLFSNVEAFESLLPQAPVDALRSIRAGFGTPEDINDSPTTAPSKRLERLIPGYRKRWDSPDLAEEIGLGRLRSECPRFQAWLQRLEALGESAGR